MIKYNNWESELINYILSVRERPFDWDGFHCLTFANGAILAQGGKGFTDPDFFNFKAAKGAFRSYKKLLRKYEKDDMAGLVDTVLTRHKNLMPPRGAIVGRQSEEFSVAGISLGVSIGEMVAFLGAEKVVFSLPEDSDIFWVIGDDDDA